MNDCTDSETLWQAADAARSVIEANLGYCAVAITPDAWGRTLHVELDRHLTEDQAMDLCAQFALPADYDGDSPHGSLFTLWL